MAEVANNVQTISGRATEFDPEFAIPPGLINVTARGEVLEGSEDTISGSETSSAAPGTLGVPKNATVVSQTVRLMPDGTAVVDVEIEVTDVPGAIKYEVRVTKG